MFTFSFWGSCSKDNLSLPFSRSSLWRRLPGNSGDTVASLNLLDVWRRDLFVHPHLLPLSEAYFLSLGVVRLG